MASVNTNAAAITALRTLQNTNASMDKTQAHISTGYKIGEAKDNAAYWAISTTLKSDNKSLATVKDALGLGASTVDTAYQGLNKAKDVLDEIKSKLTAATQDGVNRDTIQNEIGQLQDQLKSIATSSIFSGENWLSVDSSTSSYNANKQVVSSFSRDANGAVTIGNIGVNISNVALYDASTVAGKDGVLDSKQLLKAKDGTVLAYGGTADTSGNTNAAGLAGANGTVNSGAPGAANGMNTALVTGAVATGPAASATGNAATFASGTTSAVAVAGWASTDFLSFKYDIDGTGDTDVRIALSSGSGTGLTSGVATAGTITATELAAKLNANTPFAAKATVTVGSGNTLVITSKNAGNIAAGSTSVKVVTAVYDAATLTNAGSGGTGGTTGAVALTSAGAAPASSGTLNSTLTNTGLADGDVITVSYKLGSSSTVLTKDVTVTTASTFDKTAFATAWGSVAGTTVAAGSGSTIDFTHSGVAGTGSKFTISDVVVKSSAATGSVIKNVDPLSGLTGSKAQSVKTAALTWPSTLTSTDVVKVKMSGNATVFSAAAGTSLTDFVNNLNTSFGGAFTASKTAGNELVITANATGTGSTVQVEYTTIADAAGVAKSVSTTGLGLFATAATATTATFSTFTLDGNDTLDLTVQVGTGTAKKVSIDQSLVNSTLGTSANGTVDTVANFKRVVDAALLKANVSGVTTTANANNLTFTGTVGQALTIAGGTASQGTQTMSVDKMDISASGLAAVGATTSAQIKDVLTAYIDVVNSAINKVTSAAASLGSVASRIDLQKSFVNTLMDTIDKGVGNLIDADMSEESTKLQALQVKQQLGVQALSIANQASQSILSLFRS